MSSIAIGANQTPNKLGSAIFLQGIIIWTLAAIFYFFDNLLNVAPSGMKLQLFQAFNVSAGEFGMISSSYLWSYGIMQIPAGIMMDTIGPRKVLSIAGLSCALGTILFGLADSILLACVGRILIGFGSSFAVVGCTKIAASWFPPRRFALFMGLMVAVGMLGAAFGVSAVSTIIDTFGWKETLFGGAAISLVISILLWLIVRDRPPVPVNPEQEQTTTKQVPVLTGLSEVVLCGQDWLAAIYGGLMFVPTLAFGGLWGTPYLVEAHNFTPNEAGILSSLVFIGWVFGGPVYGWVSDYIGKRNPPMYVAVIATFFISLWIIYGFAHSFYTLAVFMFLLGFFSSGFLISFVVTREKNRPEISGTAIGFMNMMNTFSVALFQWLIGWILDLVATDAIITETGKAFTLADYQKALMCIPICLLFAFFALLKVKETNCIVKHEE